MAANLYTKGVGKSQNLYYDVPVVVRRCYEGITREGLHGTGNALQQLGRIIISGVGDNLGRVVQIFAMSKLNFSWLGRQSEFRQKVGDGSM